MDFGQFPQLRVILGVENDAKHLAHALLRFRNVATHSVVDRPFPDLDVPDVLGVRRDAVTPVRVVGIAGEIDEVDDRLSPARGVLFALLLCTPFWVGVYWLFS